jgi:hypothetical protein
MRHDDADPDEPSIHKGAERHPTRVDVALEFVPLCFDGVLAVTVCVPGRRAPISGPLHQLCPTLFVEAIDVLSPIDLADERELRASQPPYLDAFPHRATIAHRPPVSTSAWATVFQAAAQFGPGENVQTETRIISASSRRRDVVPCRQVSR